jgi:uncharacterized protein
LLSPKLPIKPNGNCVELNLRVQPKSSRNAYILEPDGRLRVALMAPPIDGKANKALITFIAKFFSIPKRTISLIRGEASREKTVRIEDIDAETVSSLLNKST